MSDYTTHFEDDAWLSFVRGRLAAEDAHSMHAHLSRGCEKCRQTHETWQRFVGIAQQEDGDVACESAIRLVKAAFALRRRVPFRSGLAHAAEGIFDSFQEPSPTGVRGSPASPRQLLYQVGDDLLVDLRLEQNPGLSCALTGQVVSAQSDRVTGCAGVILLREPDTVVGQTITNSLGEFQLDFDRQENLRICLEMPDGTLIEAVLPANAEVPART
jgi:hypothetical protein